jgi:signal transduction histidine kinase
MKKEPAYITVPSHWNNRYFFNTTYSTQGYATYRTEVRLPENMVGKPLAIRVSSARVASRLYVDDQALAQSGQPSTTRTAEVAKNKPYTGSFKTLQSRITIDVEVSNFHNGSSAGLNLSVILGSEQQLERLQLRHQVIDWLLICFLFFTALFFLGRWLLDLKQRADGALAVLLFSVGCFMLTSSEKWMYDLFPHMGFETFASFASISAWMVYASTFFCAYFLYPLYFRKWMIRTVIGLTVLQVLLGWLTEVYVYTPISGMMTLIVGSIIYAYVIWVFYRSYRQREPGAILLLLAVSFWLVFILHWGFSMLLTLNPHDLPPVHVPVFVLLMAFGLSVQQKTLTKQLNETELAKLRHQIKPHFLFNAINTIIWASKRDSQQARDLLLRLSDFLRGSFDFDDRDVLVPFKKELDLTEAYVAIEQARFEEELHVQMRIADEVLAANVLVPPLIFQPLVENAVRHGVMKKDGGGTVTVRADLEDGFLVLAVEDDGVGFSEEQLRAIASGRFEQLTEDRIGVGLNNVRLRLWKQYQVRLSISNHEQGGAKVEMKIPYK